MTEPEPSLTALERELMAYVEKLTEASEQSAIQFKELEEQLRTRNAERYQSIVNSLTCVMESQVHLAGGMSELANSLGKNIPKELIESQKAIEQALTTLQIET